MVCVFLYANVLSFSSLLAQMPARGGVKPQFLFLGFAIVANYLVTPLRQVPGQFSCGIFRGSVLLFYFSFRALDWDVAW